MSSKFMTAVSQFFYPHLSQELKARWNSVYFACFVEAPGVITSGFYDAIQLLTPRRIGNSWLKIIHNGRFRTYPLG